VAQGAFRTVRQGSGAAIIAGVQVPEGATLMLLQGAANRDPARYQNPAAFDLDRPVLPHLGFGYGMHSCLGLNLARLEGRILLDGLLQLVPEFGVVTPLDYGGSFSMRGPAAVPVYL
jgi:cytochrome P450